MEYLWMFVFGLFLLFWTIASILDIIVTFQTFKPRYVIEEIEFRTKVWLVSLVIVPTFISFMMYIGGIN